MVTKINAPKLSLKCVVNSLKEALSYKPDIGFVTNETSLHVDTAIKLANNGMNLFLEKPLSHSMKNVNKLQKIRIMIYAYNQG